MTTAVTTKKICDECGDVIIDLHIVTDEVNDWHWHVPCYLRTRVIVSVGVESE